MPMTINLELSDEMLKKLSRHTTDHQLLTSKEGVADIIKNMINSDCDYIDTELGRLEAQIDRYSDLPDAVISLRRNPGTADEILYDLAMARIEDDKVKILAFGDPFTEGYTNIMYISNEQLSEIDEEEKG